VAHILRFIAEVYTHDLDRPLRVVALDPPAKMKSVENAARIFTAPDCREKAM
jgi:hypothetical protein